MKKNSHLLNSFFIYHLHIQEFLNKKIIHITDEDSMKFFFYLLLAASYSSLFANEQFVGRIIKLNGDVRVFANPSDKISGPPPHALYEGKYYSVMPAKLGMKLDNGNILETGASAKARVIFKNGDQFNVGEGTAYTVSWADKTQTKSSGSVVNMMRGQLRAIVSKQGPRNNMEVKTRFASMGVRGTDFYVEKRGNIGETKLTVLRGEVSLKMSPKELPIATVQEKQKAIEEIKEVKVQSGYSASFTVPAKVEQAIASAKQDQKKIELPSIVASDIQLAVTKTDKQELSNIQKASVIKVDEKEKQIIDQATAKEFVELEKKAVETTLEDIKQYDKDLYNKAKEMKNLTVAALNEQVVKEIHKEAPAAPGKPLEADLNNLETDAYDKYFLIE